MFALVGNRGKLRLITHQTIDVVNGTGGESAILNSLLELSNGYLQDAIRGLVEIGFLEEQRGSATWKIPMLYRDGLEIRQGKAFDASASDDDE